jgi:hypothetical protein
LKKPQKNQSSFVKSVGSVDVDYPSHSARHAPKRVVERREPQYFDDAPAPAPVAEPARNIYESDDSDGEEEGGHGYGDVHVEATTTSNNTKWVYSPKTNDRNSIMITTNKISFDEANEIISDIKNRGNGDLTKVMDFLNEDFEETKNLIVELSKHLDNIETLYDSVLKEYNSRNNG